MINESSLNEVREAIKHFCNHKARGNGGVVGAVFKIILVILKVFRRFHVR